MTCNQPHPEDDQRRCLISGPHQTHMDSQGAWLSPQDAYAREVSKSHRPNLALNKRDNQKLAASTIRARMERLSQQRGYR